MGSRDDAGGSIHVTAHEGRFFAEVVRDEGTDREKILHATALRRTEKQAVADAVRWEASQFAKEAKR